MSNISRSFWAAAFALTAFVLSAPAQAQFTCTNFATGTASGSAATNAQDVACGTNATSTGGFATAVGTSATASGLASTASGSFSTASGAFSNAFGELANATGGLASAIGSNAQATADNSTAVGVLAIASGTGSTAVGVGASAQFANSASFGSGATAQRANQQAFGTAANSYTMAGINTTSTAAQVGPTKLVTADASGTLGVTTLSGLGIASTADLNAVDNKANHALQGVAMAMSLADPVLTTGDLFGIRMNYGTFDGRNALGFTALGVVDRNFLSSNSTLAIGGGISTGLNDGNVGGRLGAQITFR